jgi:hypothetical protein
MQHSNRNGPAEEFIMTQATKTRVKTKKSGGLSAGKSGGAEHAHLSEDIDGCEIDYSTVEATLDAALPAAYGGVAVAGGSRRKRASARS